MTISFDSTACDVRGRRRRWAPFPCRRGFSRRRGDCEPGPARAWGPGHALGGSAAYNAEQQEHGQPTVSVAEHVTTSQFWFESFQNRQSELLAVGSIVVLTIFLRQRSSPESKPVHQPTDETGS